MPEWQPGNGQTILSDCLAIEAECEGDNEAEATEVGMKVEETKVGAEVEAVAEGGTTNTNGSLGQRRRAGEWAQKRGCCRPTFEADTNFR